MHLALHLLRFVRALATDRTRLALENLALRGQLAVLKRSVERPKLSIPTATSAMRSLERTGIVREMTGKRRNRIYGYEQYLDILGEGTAVSAPDEKPEKPDAS